MAQNEYISESTFFIKKDAPIYTTVSGLGKYIKLVKYSLENIETFNNPRIIIIETWLILDYSVRDLIIGGLNLNKHCYRDLDLRYILLPHSFLECLRILRKIIKKQRSLEEKPKTINNEVSLKFNYKFWAYIKKNHKDFLEKFGEIKNQYYQKYYPHLYSNRKNTSSVFLPDATRVFDAFDSREYRFIDEKWLEVTNKLDEEWFKKAKKINEVRNYAAHSFDPKSICVKLGLSDSILLPLSR